MTIAWAAIGFLLMGVGLIALQVAERRRRRADRPRRHATTVYTAGGRRRAAAAGLRARSPARTAHHRGCPAGCHGPPPPGDAPYDREEWRRLVESDSDLAQIANVLADYGPQYVDELAASYLAVPDKSRLGAIVDGIIARARDAQQPAPPPAPAGAIAATAAVPAGHHAPRHHVQGRPAEPAAPPSLPAGRPTRSRRR